MIDALPTGRSFQNLSVLVPGVSMPLRQPGRRRHRRRALPDAVGARQPRRPDAAGHERHAVQQHEQHGRRLQHHAGDQHRHRAGDDGHHQRAVGRERSSGVLSNTIPKEGGNTFRGYFFGNFANDNLQSDNLNEELIAAGIDPRQQRLRSSGISTRPSAGRS